MTRMETLYNTRTIEKFFKKLQNNPDSSCMLFTGGTRGKRNETGYVEVSRAGQRYKRMSAHRFAWEAVNGPAPEGFDVRHTCDNTLCCNPGHLKLVQRTAKN